MGKWSRWLPADTRAVELSSAAALLMCALAAAGGHLAVLGDTPAPVLAVLLGCTAVLQSIGASREIGLVRTAACLMSTAWWLWDGLSRSHGGYAALALAASCLYAFVLHGASAYSQQSTDHGPTDRPGSHHA